MIKKFTFYRSFLFLLVSSLVIYAQDPVAVVIKSRGNVDIFRGEETKSREAKKGFVLQDGDQIQTAEASFCALKFIDDKSLLRVKENSSCTIEGKREEDHINKNIVVEIGSFFTSLFKPRGQFTVTTPTSVASVKGTSWWTIQLGDGRTIYIVIDDMIDCENDAGKFLVREGQTAIFSSSSLPPEINLTDDSQIPTWDEGFGTRQILEIEFENPEGEIQRLKIDYQTQ